MFRVAFIAGFNGLPESISTDRQEVDERQDEKPDASYARCPENHVKKTDCVVAVPSFKVRAISPSIMPCT